MSMAGDEAVAPEAPMFEAVATRGDVRCTARVVDLGPRGRIATGLPFLDHMLDQLTAHAQLGVSVGIEDADDLIADLNIPPALIATVLLELELAGLAERLPGNRVSRLAPLPNETLQESATHPATARRQSELF